MEKEKVKKLFELESEKRKILRTLRKTLGITDPKFRPIETKIIPDVCGFFLQIIPEKGADIKRKVYTTLSFFNDGKETGNIEIENLEAGQKWIDEEIDKLNKIDKEIDDI